MSRLQLAELIGNENIRAQLTIAHGAARLNNKAMGHILFSGQPGCHRKGTLILMADGSLKRVEDIKVHDLLMGTNGPVPVLRLHQGKDEMYRVSPIKGEPFYVNGEHILSLVHSKKRAGARIDISVTEYLKLSKTDKSSLKLFRSPGVEFATEKESLPIDPYFLGLLIGDGGFSSVSVGITSTDPEIVEECYQQASHLQLDVRRADSNGTRCPTYFFHGNSSLRDALCMLGLRGKASGKKFIPDCYKTASRSDRLSLLAGLMDADGHNHSNTFDFVTKSGRLARDIAFVARSLGLAAYPRLCFKLSQNGTSGVYHRMIISGDTNNIPCKVKRKQTQPRRQVKSVLRTGFSVVKVSDKEQYYGFTVGGNNLYLLEDFTVTHNCGKTASARALAALSGAPFFETNPESIKNPEDLANTFSKFPEDGYDLNTGEVIDIINPPILFIDEAHRLTLKTQEFLGIAMEEFHLTFTQGRGRKKRTITAWVPQFTVVCATTKEGELSKPFRDRFKLLFVFNQYEMSEAEKILRLHADKKSINIDQGAIAAIARRGRGTPRILIRLLERVDEGRAYLGSENIDVSLVEDQFELMGIDPIGLTSTDTKLLKQLYASEAPTGLDSLAVRTGIDVRTISEVNEPYLIILGFIERTKGGRIITDAGVEHLINTGCIKAPEPEFNNSRVLKVKS